MTDFKLEIAKLIAEVTKLDENELITYIEVPPNAEMGDYAFPCFKLAKELKKAPPVIAMDIKENITIDNKTIEKLDVAGGYLNFYINKETLAKDVLTRLANEKELYGSSNIGEGKTVLVEYSSPNIAKPMHMGHLRNTIIGGALYKIYKFLGYDVVGINHLGDWGINFAKIMAGYTMWKDEYDFSEDSLDPIVKIYVRFNELEKEKPEYTEVARSWHIKLESGDSEAVRLWNWLKDVSLKEAEKIYDLLNCKFDSYNGEAFYNDKMDEIIEELKAKNLLVESDGAQVIDLEEYNMPPCIALTSAGTTLYATRDLAAIKYRMKTYDYYKSLYVVGSEQQLHFKQIYKVFELMGYPEYAKKCEHIYYGLILDGEGKKMGTRKGNSLTLLELLNEGIAKSKAVIEEKGTDIEDKEKLAKQIGIGAIIFNDLSNNKNNDVVFDWNQVLNFTGETGPYIQYIYVRTRSVLEKAGYMADINEIDFSKLTDKESLAIIKLLYSFEDILINASEKNEPSIISRYLIDLASSFSTFYNEHHILVEDKEIANARIFLTWAVGTVLKTGVTLLGMEMPEKM